MSEFDKDQLPNPNRGGSCIDRLFLVVVLASIAILGPGACSDLAQAAVETFFQSASPNFIAAVAACGILLPELAVGGFVALKIWENRNARRKNEE